jgi:hypothetical protein
VIGKSSVLAAIVIAGFAGGALAPAAAADVAQENEIVIDGRTYGPEDGLVVEEGEFFSTGQGVPPSGA